MQIRFLSSPSSSRRRRRRRRRCRRLRPVLFKFLRAEGPSVFSSSLVPPFGNYYQPRHSVDWLRNEKVTRSSCQWFHKSPIFLFHRDGYLISLSREVFIRRFTVRWKEKVGSLGSILDKFGSWIKLKGKLIDYCLTKIFLKIQDLII